MAMSTVQVLVPGRAKQPKAAACRVTQKMVRSIVFRFPTLEPYLVQNYTFTRYTSAYRHARGALDIRDQDGKFILLGREFSWKPVFWNRSRRSSALECVEQRALAQRTQQGQLAQSGVTQDAKVRP